jgi:NADH-quinone oxidoreductase subunit C
VEQNAIYELLAGALGDGALGFTENALEPWAAVSPAKVADACRFLRGDPRLDFDQLMCLSGIDWDGLDEAGKGKSVSILGYSDDGQPEQSDRVATGDFGVAYHLYSHALRHKFTLRVRVPRDVATVPTVSGVWSTAAWHEREAWDLLGITFAGHPDPRRMLMEEDWVGHPLRKDYVMPGLWNGVPLQGQPYCANPFPVTSGGPDKPAGDKPAEG